MEALRCLLDVFLTIAVMYGLTFGIKDSKLLARPRNYLAEHFTFFAQLFSCPYCVGFHSGWMTFLLLNPLPLTADWTVLLRGLTAYAFAGTVVSGILDSLVLRLEGPS